MSFLRKCHVNSSSIISCSAGRNVVFVLAEFPYLLSSDSGTCLEVISQGVCSGSVYTVSGKELFGVNVFFSH